MMMPSTSLGRNVANDCHGRMQRVQPAFCERRPRVLLVLQGACITRAISRRCLRPHQEGRVCPGQDPVKESKFSNNAYFPISHDFVYSWLRNAWEMPSCCFKRMYSSVSIPRFLHISSSSTPRSSSFTIKSLMRST